MITECAWGDIWSRSQLTLRDRSMITLALLATLALGMKDGNDIFRRDSNRLQDFMQDLNHAH